MCNEIMLEICTKNRASNRATKLLRSNVFRFVVPKIGSELHEEDKSNYCSHFLINNLNEIEILINLVVKVVVYTTSRKFVYFHNFTIIIRYEIYSQIGELNGSQQSRKYLTYPSHKLPQLNAMSL